MIPALLMSSFHTGSRGKTTDVALDVAVVNPCKGGTVVEAAAVAGFALNDTFKSKMQKSAEACCSEGMLPYWEIVCLISLPLRLMADTEILRGLLGLRPS